MQYPLTDNDDDYSGSPYLSQFDQHVQPEEPVSDLPSNPTAQLDQQWGSAFGHASDGPTPSDGTVPETGSAGWGFYVPFEKWPSLLDPVLAADEAFRLFPLYLIHIVFHRTHLIVSVILLVLLVMVVIYALFDREQAGDQDGNPVKGQTRY